MCWSRPDRWLALALASLLSFGAQAQDEPLGEHHAWLLTYGPGAVYWERFGHNAIWLQEPALGLDHSFNFGFFDFEQENFLLRFVQGRMLYFSAAVPAERELSFYRDQGRTVRIQELALDPAQYTRLRDHLLHSVQPENRDYRYDYYLDNCSTRIRDAIDVALDGALSAQFRPQPGLQTFREHTRRSTVRDYWYYLGLELALGVPVDRPVSRWDEMFLPAMVADSLPEVTVLETTRLRALIAEDRMLAPDGITAPPATPPEVWWRYALSGLAIAAVLALLARFAPGTAADGLLLGLLLIAGTLGCLMVADWLWTDHRAANPNANLLLLNPLLLLAMVPGLRRPASVIIGLGLAAAVVVIAWPGLQYTRDVFAFLAPALAVAAGRLWVMGRERGKQRR